MPLVETIFAVLDEAVTLDTDLSWRTNSEEQAALVDDLPPDLAARAIE